MRRHFVMISFVALLLVITLALTGCGEQKRYEEAAALEAEGKYHDAWQIYLSLGRKKYKDSEEKAEQMRYAAYRAAKTALAEGRWDDAEAIASPFSWNVPMETISNYAQIAKEGTYVRDLSLSEDGRISFTAAIGPTAADENGDAKLVVALSTSPNGRASGSVHTAEKGEKAEADGYFIPEDYLQDGKYVIAEVPLDAWIYSASARSMAIADFDQLADSTLQTLQMMQMAHFPVAYEAVMNDGTPGALLSEWVCNNLQFRDPMNTFAGGTVAVRIVSSDGKTTLFELTVDIPADETSQDETAQDEPPQQETAQNEAPQEEPAKDEAGEQD